ncbi:hypothetical protein D3C72_1602220 [compost metagenome]
MAVAQIEVKEGFQLPRFAGQPGQYAVLDARQVSYDEFLSWRSYKYAANSAGAFVHNCRAADQIFSVVQQFFNSVVHAFRAQCSSWEVLGLN